MNPPLRSALISAPALLLLGGCVSSGTRETGIRVGDETLKQFEVGVTTDDWLLAILGPPTSESMVNGVANTRVLRYATGEQSAGLSSLLSGGAGRTTAVTYFIITDGLVTRYWSDRATQYTVLGDAVERPAGEKLDK